MDISPDQVRKAIVSVIAFVLCVSVHEFGHAWMANRLGDRLPASQGRLTLSPLAHIDLIGTILMPLVAALAPGGFPFIAWGKPVQTNPANYTATRLSRRMGHVLVSLMGPAMNLLMALLISVVLVVAAHVGTLPATLVEGAITYFLVLNLMLMFFNLLPLPPLDGGAVLAGLLPESMQTVPRFLQRYGVILFFVLLMSGAMRVLMRPVSILAGVWVEALLRLMAR